VPRSLALVVTLLACEAPRPAAEATETAEALVDRDGDGLDDAFEDRLAREYLPYLANDPADGCALSGIVFRVRPHPADPAFVAVVHVRLYHEDCGIGGHIGDDEVFGMTIDPRRPAPAGIVAMTAIGHQDTLCEQITACGQCPGQAPCDVAMVDGQPVPVVFASRNKHANYVLAGRCTLTACLDRCALAPTPASVPMVNAGEPGRPRIHDLTSEGFITEANGWTHAALLHLDPWDATRKVGGGATGTVASRLVDPQFIAPVCAP
jgi:hypothetical protein